MFSVDSLFTPTRSKVDREIKTLDASLVTTFSLSPLDDDVKISAIRAVDLFDCSKSKASSSDSLYVCVEQSIEALFQLFDPKEINSVISLSSLIDASIGQYRTVIVNEKFLTFCPCTVLLSKTLLLVHNPTVTPEMKTKTCTWVAHSLSSLSEDANTDTDYVVAQLQSKEERKEEGGEGGTDGESSPSSENEKLALIGTDTGAGILKGIGGETQPANTNIQIQKRENEVNRQCFQTMLSYVPHHVHSTTLDRLSEDVGEGVANRLWANRVLWLLRMRTADIEKIHISDLRGRYQYHDVDMVECRALNHCLFDCTFTGQKQEWREGLRNKLSMFQGLELAGKLRESQRRNAVYALAAPPVPSTQTASAPRAISPLVADKSGADNNNTDNNNTDNNNNDNAPRSPIPTNRRSNSVAVGSESDGVEEEDEETRRHRENCWGSPMPLLGQLEGERTPPRSARKRDSKGGTSNKRTPLFSRQDSAKKDRIRGVTSPHRPSGNSTANSPINSVGSMFSGNSGGGVDVITPQPAVQVDADADNILSPPPTPAEDGIWNSVPTPPPYALSGIDISLSSSSKTVVDNCTPKGRSNSDSITSASSGSSDWRSLRPQQGGLEGQEGDIDTEGCGDSNDSTNLNPDHPTNNSNSTPSYVGRSDRSGVARRGSWCPSPEELAEEIALEGDIDRMLVPDALASPESLQKSELHRVWSQGSHSSAPSSGGRAPELERLLLADSLPLAKDLLMEGGVTRREASLLLLKLANGADRLPDPLEALRVLVDEGGADVNVRDENSSTPLHFLFSTPLMGRFLVSRGSDVMLSDNQGDSPLSLCLEFGYDYLVPTFIKAQTARAAHPGKQALSQDVRRSSMFATALLDGASGATVADLNGLSLLLADALMGGALNADALRTGADGVEGLAARLMTRLADHSLFEKLAQPMETYELLVELSGKDL